MSCPPESPPSQTPKPGRSSPGSPMTSPAWLATLHDTPGTDPALAAVIRDAEQQAMVMSDAGLRYAATAYRAAAQVFEDAADLRLE